jgi:hypothetical protein
MKMILTMKGLTNNQSVQGYSRNSAPKLEKEDATASMATSNKTESAKINLK